MSHKIKPHEFSLNLILDYLWQDEAHDFFDRGALADDHIFYSLLRAKIWLGREWYVESACKDYMYAESPFDLGSDEDNAYRNLVDDLMKKPS